MTKFVCLTCWKRKDDSEIRWVEDRIEYWDTNDRILTKDEMLEANDLWRLYNGPINVVRK